MSSKIDKTIARLQERIQEGQFYEAHQQLRVVASRYSKQKNWTAAIEILVSGAQELLKAKQYGSGADLGRFLVNILDQAEIKPDAGNRGKLMSMIRLFPPEEPDWKRLGDEMLSWSAKFGEFPAGDPELHEAVGELYAEEPEPYEAERHLVMGTKSSPEHLANLEYSWYTEDEAHTTPLYAARAVLPYLLVGNVRDATRSFQIYTDRLVQTKSNLGVHDIEVSGISIRVFPSLPLLNFLAMLLVVVQRGKADLFRQLRKHYAVHEKEVDNIWDEALERIGEMYFNIPVRRQTNPLFEMMGSLFGGGAPSNPQPALQKIEPPAPPAMDLD